MIVTTSATEEEKLKVALIASAVIDELSRRYSLTPQDVSEAVAWVREHKDFVTKLKHGGYMALIGTLIGTALLVAWEGVKAYIRKVIT